MLSEAVAREVRVSLHDVDDDGTPGDDVPLLRFFVEQGEGADDVGAETVQQR